MSRYRREDDWLSIGCGCVAAMFWIATLAVALGVGVSLIFALLHYVGVI